MDDTSRPPGSIADPHGAGTGHYWTMEHYGFADDHVPSPPPPPPPRTPARSARPVRAAQAPHARRPARRRTGLIASGVLALSMLTGVGAFAAAQATADPGDGGGAGGITTVGDVVPGGFDGAGDGGGRGGRGGGPR